MAVAEGRMRLKVYLDEGQRVAEIFVSPTTQCKDIVHRLQRQVHATDCFLLEVWQGCERLVPDNELILSTLLEWGSDLEDVKFYLRRREEAVSFTRVVNAPLRVNGFKAEPRRDVLLGGGHQLSVNNLKEFAAKQQQEIVAKERELKAKQIQLMEMKRKSQNKPQNPYVQQLSAKADEQGERLTALRHVQDQVDSYKLSNSALAEELDSVRSLFMEKEKELAIAVAKVESLTQQLDKQRQGWSQSSPSREETHQQLELERLRKELMTRNELNHQQSVQIQSQKQLLAEKHKELFELDAQIEQYTEELRQKRSKNNHMDHENGSSPSPRGEQDFVEMDYSNLANFSKKTNKTDSKNGSASATSGSFRVRSRNSRKLETLLEVEEEVSDGHASNKSFSEDLTQGPGPPRVSRVTALKSRFKAEGAKDGGKHWNAHDKLSHNKKKFDEYTAATEKFSNGFPNSTQRVEPEGVETPDSPASESLVDEEKGANYSSTLPSDQGAETKRELNQALQQSSFEFPNSHEVKHILREFDLRTETPSWNSGRSTPSDGGDVSGLSSPSSLSSSSSVSSNSTSPKAAVFAVTGMVKKTDNSQNLTASPHYENAMADGNGSPQRDIQGLSKAVNSPYLRSQIEEPVHGVLNANSLRDAYNVNRVRGAQDGALQVRRVKSEGFPTKNENVGSIARPTVLDFSRAGMKPKDFDVTDNSNDKRKASSLAQEKNVNSSAKTGKVQLSRLQYPPVSADRTLSPRYTTPDSQLSQTLLNRDTGDQSSNRTASKEPRKTIESSLKDNIEKTELNATSPRLPNNPIHTNDLLQEEVVTASPSSGSFNPKAPVGETDRKMDEISLKNGGEKTKLNTRYENTNGSHSIWKGEKPTPLPSPSSSNMATPSEETKRTIETSSTDNRGNTELDIAASRLPQSSTSMNSFIQNGGVPSSSPSSAHLNKDDKPEQDRSVTDETDNARKLPEEEIPSRPTFDRPQLAPLTFKPISFRAKKLANQQQYDQTSLNRSQLAPLISNSISVRGQSSLTKITVTPSAAFFSSAATDIPEKRSPVPTSKRTRFVNRFTVPTHPEVGSREPSQGNFHDGINQNQGEFLEKERLDTETTTQMDFVQSYKGASTNQQGQRERNPAKATLCADGKQVVSSFNIQLSSQKRTPVQEKKGMSSTEENDESNSSVDTSSNSLSTESNITDVKQLNSDRSGLGSKTGQVIFESARPSSGSGRLNAENDRLNTESGQMDSGNGNSNSGLNSEKSPTVSSQSTIHTFHSDNNENVAGGSSKSQRRQAAFNKNVSTMSLIKLSPPKQGSAPLKEAQKTQFAVRESIPPVNAENSRDLDSRAESLPIELSSTRTAPSVNTEYIALGQAGLVKSSQTSPIDERKISPVEERDGLKNAFLLGLNDNGIKTEERVTTNNQSQRRVEAKEFITSKDLQVTASGDDKPKAVDMNGETGLDRQSKNAISDQKYSAINNLHLTVVGDDNAKPTMNGDIGPVGQSHPRISDQSGNSLVSTLAQGKITGTDVFSKEITALGESLAQAPAQKTDRKKKARRVSLDPHAVLLDAAVEGELDKVKEIVGEVDDPSKPNSDGITALHNAVCASHDEVVKFLVQYGCNINSQDSHGWTPLHCAAANNATDLSRLLVEHGACILAVTSLEKKTPEQCCERGLPGYFSCIRYLNDVQQNLGLANEGRVYALYSYSATEQDELSFECGEELRVLKRGDATEREWWWAENKNGQTGYIPRNLLGSHARISYEV